MKLLRYSFEIVSGTIICCLATASTVWSQSITGDGTLSTNITSPDSLNFTITGGNRAGDNLFHSFSQFSVPTDGSAFFNNAPDIRNIIGRVTGGSVSNIDGLIRANSNANLFLINPSGIIFGPNVRLNIGGSILASTASSLNFADGTEFAATVSTPPLLTVSVPIGLQFGASPQEILAQRSNLVVRPGNTLALVGGNLTLNGSRLIASGGRIELGSVAGSSLVSLTPINSNLVLGYEGVQNFQDIQLSQLALVNTSGFRGGDIQVQSRRLTLSDGSQIISATGGSQLGGTLSVNASDAVELIGTSADGQTRSGLLSVTAGTGGAGDLTIKTGRFTVQNGAQVINSTSSSGVAGNVTVTASNLVEVIGTSADGQTPSVLLSGTFGSGAAGNLAIATKKLIVRDGGMVNASTLQNGIAGDVTVSASESVEVIGTSADGQIPSSLRSDALVNLPPGLRAQFNLLGDVIGNAGDLRITTKQLIVQNGAVLAVSNEGRGNGGDLKVTADTLQVDNGNIIAETKSGEGGNITLQAHDLLLRNNSRVSTTAGGAGNGGDITMDTDVLAVLETSEITANAFEGQGGNIVILTQGFFLSPDSNITASSNLGVDGVVEINPLDIDPSSGLATLPEEVVNVEGLVAQNCSADGGQASSQFIVTGRGGLPTNPSDTLSSDIVLTNLGTRVPRAENRPSSVISSNPTSLAPVPIVEAQGWVIAANGDVILTAQAPNTPRNPWLTPAACHAS